GRLHAVGHVRDADEDIELEIMATLLLGTSLGVDSVPVVIVVFIAELLKTVRPDVVVGHYQAVRRYKGARSAAIEAYGISLQVLQPGVGRIEIVALLQNLPRRIVEQPHAFVAPRGGYVHG